jgi:hypothetical protein
MNDFCLHDWFYLWSRPGLMSCSRCGEVRPIGNDCEDEYEED